MRRVIIESPYAGDVELNLRYLRACLADSLGRGEAPFASHAIYTHPGVLDDTKPEERRKGIEAGYAWWAGADAIVFYTDLGWSPGMRVAMARAKAYPQIPLIQMRILGRHNAWSNSVPYGATPRVSAELDRQWLIAMLAATETELRDACAEIEMLALELRITVKPEDGEGI